MRTTTSNQISRGIPAIALLNAHRPSRPPRELLLLGGMICTAEDYTDRLTRSGPEDWPQLQRDLNGYLVRYNRALSALQPSVSFRMWADLCEACARVAGIESHVQDLIWGRAGIDTPL